MSAQPQSNRFENIDTLRGVAVLGILMMNIQAFAMVFAAYTNPPAHMDMTGANAAVWFYGHVFFSMKFITIFSGLFGAGILLMLGEEKTPNIKIHYRRMLWLLVIGLIHAWIFWSGDILVPYAVMGMLVVLARRMGPVGLTIMGSVFLLLVGGLMAAAMWSLNILPPEQMEWFAPSAERVAELETVYREGFIARLGENMVLTMQAEKGQLTVFAPRLAGVMFIGMALYKWGFLTLQWSAMRYLMTAVISLGIGLPTSWYAASHALETGFAIETFWIGETINYFASLPMALGYAAMIMLVCKLGVFNLILKPFAAVGRMAFTNYLTHTLVMTFIFVGPPGLGLFGTVERIDQFQIVVAVWIAQLIISPLWLSWFRFGPMEWVWRSLTYWKLQPMLKRKSSEPTPPTPA
jgi:uncharacterized protein